MSGEPVDLQLLGMVLAPLGTVEFGYGTWLSQSPGPKRGIGYLLQGSGLGFLGASLLLYLSWNYEQSLICAIAVGAAGALTGALRFRNFLQDSPGDQQQ